MVVVSFLKLKPFVLNLDLLVDDGLWLNKYKYAIGREKCLI